MPLRIGVRSRMVFLALLIPPLVFITSSFYTWTNHRKLYRWYRKLRDLETEMTGTKEAMKIRDFQEKLNRIETPVNAIHVPLAFFADLYRLKEHVIWFARSLNGSHRKRRRREKQFDCVNGHLV